ncbi:SET domain-containing protein [Schizophyllum commune H4-8]|nr:SET domain-containing protein [Schizophyllum commune H4-8]KAI5894448.1 SET domain-containing protein [Schizophyllum commune H4-8]
MDQEQAIPPEETILRMVKLELSQVSGTDASARSSIVACVLDQLTLDMLNTIPTFLGYESLNPDDAPYCITPSSDPAVGLGMFVKEDLTEGDLILAERPLAILPASVLGGFSESDLEDLFDQLTALMDDRARSAFFALADCHKGPCRALGIFKTNGIGLGDDLVYPDDSGDSAYVGVFERASRINHSCSPNAVYHFDLQSFCLVVRAIRHISKGEEIFISYSETLLQAATRRQNSLQDYGFRCACPACAMSDISDAHRARIGSARPVDLRTPPEEIVAISGEQVWLIELEGLQMLGQYVENALFLIVAYTALEDPARAAVYEDKVRCWEIAIRGEHANFDNIELAKRAGLRIAAAARNDDT